MNPAAPPMADGRISHGNTDHPAGFAPAGFLRLRARLLVPAARPSMNARRPTPDALGAFSCASSPVHQPAPALSRITARTRPGDLAPVRPHGQRQRRFRSRAPACPSCTTAACQRAISATKAIPLVTDACRACPGEAQTAVSMPRARQRLNVTLGFIPIHDSPIMTPETLGYAIGIAYLTA